MCDMDIHSKQIFDIHEDCFIHIHLSKVMRGLLLWHVFILVYQTNCLHTGVLFIVFFLLFIAGLVSTLVYESWQSGLGVFLHNRDEVKDYLLRVCVCSLG